MSYYPQSAVGLNYAVPTIETSSPLNETTLSIPGANNTKGAWTEIFAATSFEANAIRLNPVFASSANTQAVQLVDIGIGAAGSETVIIPNLLVSSGNPSTSQQGGHFEIPVKIPLGSRVVGRFQTSNQAAAQMTVSVMLVAAGGLDGITPFFTVGVDTSTSKGVVVDPGATANTKGAFVELSSSLPALAQWILVMATLGGNNTPVTARWALDIALGAAGSETVLIPNIRLACAVNEHRSFAPYGNNSFLTYIPAGTRVSARAACSTNNATDRLIQVAILGGTAPAESGGGSSEHSFVFVG